MTEELAYKLGIPALIVLVGALLRVGLMNRLERVEKTVSDLTDAKTGVRAELSDVRLEIARTIPTSTEMEQEIIKALKPVEEKLTRMERMLVTLVRPRG